MVVRTVSGLKDVYQLILQKTIELQGIVVVYACYDLDSICAAKILAVVTQWRQKLFGMDGIRYKIIPVSGYTDLDARFDNLKEVENVVLTAN